MSVPTGSYQTSTNPAPITTTSGSVSGGNNFGLFIFGTISGTVYNDTNGNGTKDISDQGIVGDTVFLDTNNNGILDTARLASPRVRAARTHLQA